MQDPSAAWTGRIMSWNRGVCFGRGSTHPSSYLAPQLKLPSSKLVFNSLISQQSAFFQELLGTELDCLRAQQCLEMCALTHKCVCDATLSCYFDLLPTTWEYFFFRGLALLSGLGGGFDLSVLNCLVFLLRMRNFCVMEDDAKWLNQERRAVSLPFLFWLN